MSLSNQLSKPFPAKDIHFRVGAMTKDKSKCIPLAYLNARDVMRRFDEVVGVENWQCRYPFAGCCEISIRVGDSWITKANCADETNIEGVKGQASGSFKRAAVLFGVGQYLYDIPNVWVSVDQYKNITKEALEDLTKRLDTWQSQLYGER